MTGDIKSILENSDAVASLRMEGAVADVFRKAGWATSRSVYYVDGDTQKTRETDVVALKMLDRPKRRKGIGAPVVNVKIVCECKSFIGSNILFFDEGPSKHVFTPEHFWIGAEREVENILRQLRDVLKIERIAETTSLMDYFYERAYLDNGRGLNSVLNNYLPPVDIVRIRHKITASFPGF